MRASRAAVIALLLLVPPGLAVVVDSVRQQPRRFAEVIPGGLYRGAFPTGEQIRWLRKRHHIQTVVSLTDYRDEAKYNEELRAAEAMGVRFLRFPMPGDGCAELGDLDRAADALGSRDLWPIFFHCAAGKQRSNAVLAAYRMKQEGWTLAQALAELERDHGLDRATESELVERLTEYDRWLTASGGRK